MTPQTLVMVVFTLIGCVGAFVYRPFVGLAVYIGFAVMRPQHLWEYQLPRPEVPWSFYVAVATILATFTDTFLLGRRLGNRPASAFPAARPRLTIMHVLFFSFGVWLFISSLTAYVPSHANVSEMVHEANMKQIATATDEYVKMFLICIFAWWLVRTPNEAWALVVIYALCIGYIGLDTNLYYKLDNKLTIREQGYGNLDNNGAGVLLALGVPTCIYCWEKCQGWYRWLFIPLVPSIIHTIMLTNSRGAMLSVVVTAPLWILRGPERKRKLLFGVVCGAIAVAFAGEAVQERFFSTAEYSKDESATTRFDAWTAAYRMACREPIFGYGTRVSPYFIQEFRPELQQKLSENKRHKDGVTAVHNQYLQIAADNGFVGMGLYIGMIVGSLMGYQRVIRATRDDPHPDARSLLMTAYAMQTALLTFCFGALFLSLEAFEPQYYLIFLGCQLPLMLHAKSAISAPVRYGPMLPMTAPRQRPQPPRPPATLASAQGPPAQPQTLPPLGSAPQSPHRPS